VRRGVFLAGIVKPITDRERTERQARVTRAVASIQLEGLDPTQAARAVFDRYVDGELTVQEMVEEIRALNARHSGPVPVSRD
jgi:hypothetical protein